MPAADVAENVKMYRTKQLNVSYISFIVPSCACDSRRQLLGRHHPGPKDPLGLVCVPCYLSS